MSTPIVQAVQTLRFMNHDLKTIGTCFDAVASGAKKFEVRLDDRFFQTGDQVTLIRLPDNRDSRFKTLAFTIGWILRGGQFGIEPGYCVFSLEPIDEAGSVARRGTA